MNCGSTLVCSVRGGVGCADPLAATLSFLRQACRITGLRDYPLAAAVDSLAYGGNGRGNTADNRTPRTGRVAPESRKILRAVPVLIFYGQDTARTARDDSLDDHRFVQSNGIVVRVLVRLRRAPNGPQPQFDPLLGFGRSGRIRTRHSGGCHPGERWPGQKAGK